jgi:hypothetical protein
VLMPDLAVDAAIFDQAGLQPMAGLAESDEHGCSGIISSDDSHPSGQCHYAQLFQEFQRRDDADRAPAVPAYWLMGRRSRRAGRTCAKAEPVRERRAARRGRRPSARARTNRRIATAYVASRKGQHAWLPCWRMGVRRSCDQLRDTAGHQRQNQISTAVTSDAKLRAFRRTTTTANMFLPIS